MSSGKEKSGCGSKLVMTAGIGFALMCVVVCAGGYFMWQKMRGAITTDPAKIQKISEAVVDLDVPAGLKPEFGMDLKIAGEGMSMAVFTEKDSGGSMWVMSISTPYDPNKANVDDVMRDMERQQKDNPQQQKQKIIKLEEQEDIEKDVNGRLGKFVVGRGKDEDGVDHIQVMGIFESKSKDMGMFNLVIPEEEMDMEAGRKLVESVK